MELLRRFFFAVMAGVFVSWAYFQLNDPDALLWVLLYGFTAGCTGLEILRRLHPAIPVFLGVFAFGWAWLIAWEVTGGVGFDAVFAGFLEDVGEPGRELVGLLVTAAWNGVLAYVARRRRLPELDVY